MGIRKRRTKYFEKEIDKIKDFFYNQEWSDSIIKYVNKGGKDIQKHHFKLQKM